MRSTRCGAAAACGCTCASGATPDGPPILFIHGWSQNHLCWAKQYESALADEFRLVAYDLRGHGMSEAPLEPEHYTDGKLWADDVAAIIDELRLDRPVLVGWSYGAFVICDYVRAHGQDRIAAIDFVEGAVKLGEAAFGTLIGPGFLDHFADATADDLPTNIRAMRAFVRACVVEAALGRRPRDGAVLEHRRAGRGSAPTSRPARSTDDDVLRALEVPLLVTHGRADTVVLPAMAEHVLATCPTAEASWYDGVGHAPHLEEPERFNRELAELTRRVRGLISADAQRTAVVAARRRRQTDSNSYSYPRRGGGRAAPGFSRPAPCRGSPSTVWQPTGVIGDGRRRIRRSAPRRHRRAELPGEADLVVVARRPGRPARKLKPGNWSCTAAIVASIASRPSADGERVDVAGVVESRLLDASRGAPRSRSRSSCRCSALPVV